MSKASDAARERMIQDVQRVPTIQPAHAINRAKQGEGMETAPIDPNSPNGVAEVNGMTVQGSDGPVTNLPEALNQKTRDSLANAGFGTVELVRAATDEQLNEIEGFGPATIKQIRDAVK